MAGEGPYISEDQRYGALVGNLLNPPAEGPEQPTSGAQPNAPASAAAQAIRAGAQAGGQPTQAPPPAQPKPAATPAPTPNAVTPSGNGPAASAPQKSWATDGYQRFSQAQQGALDAAGRAAQSSAALQNTPGLSAQNAPLEQRRQALAAPIPYRDPTTGKVLTSAVDPVSGETIDPAQLYKPGLGTRIARAIIPGRMNHAPINAPNSNYQAAEAIRQGQAAAIQQQEDRNLSNYKAESDRNKDIGSEARGVATAYGNVAKDEVAEQTAEQKADYNTEIAGVRQQLADVRQRLADQGGRPKNAEQAIIAAHLEPDPVLAKKYEDAANDFIAKDAKKFQYAQKALGVGDNDPRYQPIVDAATAQVNLLNTYRYNPRLNGNRGAFYDPAKPNTYYSPEEFTAKKNEIATKLDKDLALKKLPPLRVRFNVKDTTPGGAQAAAQPAGAPAAAPNAAIPSSGKQVSLAQARDLPFNKGKTDAQITADIKAHGHTVAP